jgi:hypothetical protein
MPNKPLLPLLALSSALFALTGCLPEETSEPSDKATMCYSISGSTLSLSCATDEYSSCSDYGRSDLASYSDWDTCYDDMDYVLNYWGNNGSLVSGPNSGSGSSGGSSSGGGSSSSGTYSYTYTCPGGYGGGATVDIPNDSCSSESERFARTFGCNLIDDFGSACYAYYGCLGVSSSQLNAVCGAY